MVVGVMGIGADKASEPLETNVHGEFAIGDVPSGSMAGILHSFPLFECGFDR
jgi:hypothetical protein